MNVTIVSVYPRELSVQFPWSPNRGAGVHQYTIPGGSPGKPSRLEITDAFQKNYYGEDIGFRYDLIPAREIAENFVKNFIEGVVGLSEGAHPGLAILDPARPEKEQLQDLVTVQDQYYETLYRNAEYYANHNQFDNILDDHRMAAKALGRNPSWLNPLRSGDTVKCPLCQSDISAEAYVCPICSREVRPIPKNLGVGTK